MSETDIVHDKTYARNARPFNVRVLFSYGPSDVLNFWFTSVRFVRSESTSGDKKKKKLSFSNVKHLFISTPENVTIHYSNKKRFLTVYEHDSELRKPLGLRLQQEMLDVSVLYQVKFVNALTLRFTH